MLEHQRALQITAAVQSRRQPEVAFEQRARLPEEHEQLIAIQSGHE
jgi:hypothetical protein